MWRGLIAAVLTCLTVTPAARAEPIVGNPLIAIDGGDWQPLEPLDGVADSAEERYQTLVEPVKTQPGRHAIRVRVTDSSGNLGGDAWPLDAN